MFSRTTTVSPSRRKVIAGFALPRRQLAADSMNHDNPRLPVQYLLGIRHIVDEVLARRAGLENDVAEFAIDFGDHAVRHTGWAVYGRCPQDIRWNRARQASMPGNLRSRLVVE
jgi:hypothetical protein